MLTVTRGQTVDPNDIPALKGDGNYIDEGNDSNHVYYTWDADPATAVIESNTIFTMVKNTEDHDYESGFVFREDSKTGVVYQSVCKKCNHVRQYGVKLDFKHISISQGIPYELTVGGITTQTGYLDITTAKPIISALEKVGVIPAGTGSTINTIIDVIDKVGDVADKIVERTTECAKSGHLYGEPTYSWNKEHTECTATFTCKRDECHSNYDNHTFTKKMNITGPVYTYGSCTEDGTETYTATCKFTDTNIGSVDGFDADHDFITQDVKVWQPRTGHNWNIRISNNDATCTEDGTYKRVCANCGAVQDNLPDSNTAKGHTAGAIRKENPVDATCSEQGSYDAVRYCVRCNIEMERNTVPTPVKGHTPSEAVKENEQPADCTNAGSYDSVVYCADCGEEISRETVSVPAKGHKVVVVTENLSGSTCTVNGTYDKVTKCSVCGEESGRETITLQTADHDYQEVVTPATCTEDGKIEMICSVCGDKYTSEILEATDHEYSETVVDPTCTKEGYTIFTCIHCGDTFTGDETPVSDHNWDGGVETKPATCEEKGTMTYTCTECGATNSSEIPKNNHSWSATPVPASCTDIGYTKYVCSKCNNERIENIKQPTGHKEKPAVKENSVEATCKTEGSYDLVVYCEHCNKELRREHVTVQKKPHDSDKVTKNPTCTEQGYTMYKCKVCGEEYKASFTYKDHTPVEIPAVKATCVKTGLTAGTKCSECNKILEEQKIVPITDHKWNSGIITKQPTVDETGIKTYTCNVCSATRTETVPKLTVEEATPTNSEADSAAVNRVIKEPAGITTLSHIKQKQLDIFFDKVPGAQNYRVMYRAQGSKNWNYAWTDGKTEYSLKNLKKGGLYEFMFAAYKKNAKGEWERGDYSKTSYRYYYKATIKKIKAGKKSITVKWAKNKSGNGYELYYSTRKDMSNKKKVVIKNKKKTSYKIKGLKKGKKYYIRVRSIKKKGGKTYTGEYSQQKTAKAK